MVELLMQSIYIKIRTSEWLKDADVKAFALFRY